MLFTRTPTSSPTSRATHCSSDSPGSTKPASALYMPGGKWGLRPSRICLSLFTKAMMAGATLGYAVSLQEGQTRERSSRFASVGVPQRPQNWWVRSQSTSCSARPASAKWASSSTEKSVLKPSQDMPAAGAGASFGSSAAQQSTPASRPRYSVRAALDPNQLWFFCNGTRAQDGRERTRGSSEGRGSGGPISTSSWSPRKTNQYPSPGALQKDKCSYPAGVAKGSSREAKGGSREALGGSSLMR